LRRAAAAAAIAILLASCASAPPPQPQPSDTLRGVASWYGQEYAGRTTANGEIFDPWQLTAAHRTLPFGTVLDVTNTKNGQTVRVRVNDRGPYINDRLIDISYAAAAKIGLVEPGVGDVQLTVIKLGKGEREPPAPYIVTVPEVKPSDVPPAKSVEEVPVVVEEKPVEVAPVETRKVVSPDGKRIETVAPVAPPRGGQPRGGEPRGGQPPSVVQSTARYVVQVGAFAMENNAKLLQDQLATLGEKAYIDHTQLYHVRIGPFATRDEAVRMRTRLEGQGLSAIVVAQ
jgi:rare lipoprotein A